MSPKSSLNYILNFIYFLCFKIYLHFTIEPSFDPENINFESFEITTQVVVSLCPFNSLKTLAFVYLIRIKSILKDFSLIFILTLTHVTSDQFLQFTTFFKL